MKQVLLMIAVALIAIPAAAQQQTLFEGDFTSGGFGGPVAKATQINGTWGVMAGGAGAWYVNHSFALGLAGYGLTTNVESSLNVDSLRYLDLGYGGATLEYVLNSDDLVHFSVNTLIGAGAVNYRRYPQELFEDHFDRDENKRTGDAFFVVEPGANVELNVASWMRVNVGASYRIVNGIELDGLSNSDISGPSANLMLKFGSF
jgi:hypothetical protein